MKKVRIAVVGVGWIATDYFMPGTARVRNAEITAFVTGNPKKHAALANRYGVKHVVHYDDYEAFLASGAVDAVYVATPNHLHASQAITALKQGVHALVEKPLATTLKEAEAMVAAAKKGRAILMTAMRLHAVPGFVQFMGMIRDGAIGKPRNFIMPLSFQIQKGNHRLKASAWGGPLQDLGVYCVNAARHVFGAEPTEVVAMAARGSGDARFKEIDECVSAILRFPNGGQALFASSFGAYGDDRIVVVGDTGKIELDHGCNIDPPHKITLTTDKGSKVIKVPAVQHFAGQTSYFVDCIQARRNVVPDGEEGLADMKVLLAIEKSAASGKVQKIAPSKRKVPRLNGTLRNYPLRG